MTFKNYKSLSIGNWNFKKLVRASDNLVLFEKRQMMIPVEYIYKPTGLPSDTNINIGIRPEDNDLITWNAKLDANAAQYASLGWTAYNDENTECTRIIKNSNSQALIYFRSEAAGGSRTVSVNALDNWHSYALRSYTAGDNTSRQDGIRFRAPVSSYLSENRNNYKLAYSAKSYIGNFYISRNSVPVIDLQPVRFLNEYGRWEAGMYDKISDQIFKCNLRETLTYGPDQYTVNDYIQDGLIAQFDAEFNTKDKTYSSDPNELGLMVGGQKLNFSNGSGYTTDIKDLLAPSYAETKSLYCGKEQGNSWSLFTQVPGIYDALKNGLCTFEICTLPCDDGKITAYNTQEWGMQISIGGNQENIAGLRRALQNCKYLTTAFNNKLYYVFSNDKTLATFNTYQLVKNTSTVIASKGSSYFDGSLFRNGAKLTGTPSAYYDAIPALGDFMTIRSMGSSIRTHPFRIYNIRFYNRRLTPDEINHNYQVDRSRFYI